MYTQLYIFNGYVWIVKLQNIVGGKWLTMVNNVPDNNKTILLKMTVCDTHVLCIKRMFVKSHIFNKGY